MSGRAQAVRRMTEIIEIIQETKGWGARHGERHIYITSPEGDQFSAPVKLGELNLKRLTDWVQARGLDLTPRKRPAHPDGSPTLPEAVAPPVKFEELVPPEEAPKAEVEMPSDETLQALSEQPVYACPECEAEGKVWTSHSPQGLGSHRFRVHKITGTSADAIRKQRKRANTAKTAKARQVKAVRHAARVAAGQAQTEIASGNTETLMGQVDTAWALMREEIVSAVEGLHDAESVAVLKQQNESLSGTLDGIRHAIETYPMAKAFAVIADLVTSSEPAAK